MLRLCWLHCDGGRAALPRLATRVDLATLTMARKSSTRAFKINSTRITFTRLHVFRFFTPRPSIYSILRPSPHKLIPCEVSMRQAEDPTLAMANSLDCLSSVTLKAGPTHSALLQNLKHHLRITIPSHVDRNSNSRCASPHFHSRL